MKVFVLYIKVLMLSGHFESEEIVLEQLDCPSDLGDGSSLFSSLINKALRWEVKRLQNHKNSCPNSTCSNCLSSLFLNCVTTSTINMIPMFLPLHQLINHMSFTVFGDLRCGVYNVWAHKVLFALHFFNPCLTSWCLASHVTLLFKRWLHSLPILHDKEEPGVCCIR